MPGSPALGLLCACGYGARMQHGLCLVPVILEEQTRGHPGPTGSQSHHTQFPNITLYMGFTVGI